MCQVRLTRLLKPDSLSRRLAAFRLNANAVAAGGEVTWQPVGGTPPSKQPKLPVTLPSDELSKRKCRVPAVSVSTLGMRSKSTEAKNAVCLVVRTVSW